MGKINTFDEEYTGLERFPGGIAEIRRFYEFKVNSFKNPETTKAKRFACRHDLRYLCRDTLGMKDWDEIHDDIQEFFDKSKKRFKLLLIPRGHLKSSIVTVGRSIQKILRSRNIRILVANAIWDNAKGFLDEIQHYMDDSSPLPEYFGNFRPNLRTTKGWNAVSITTVQRTRPMAAATVTTTGLERTQTSQHYDYIILDDVVARENIGTSAQRDKVKSFYKDCLSLLEPDGELVVIGTTWHEDDLYAQIRENEAKRIKQGAEPRFDIYIRQATENGKVIFPKKFNQRILNELKEDLGPYQFSAQYMLNPYPEEDMEFQKRWLRTWKHEHEGVIANAVLPNDPMYVAITIDPSLGKENSDYQALVASGITYNGEVYVLEARRFKRRIEDLPKEVVKMVKDLKAINREPQIIGLESFGFQQLFSEPIKEALKEAKLSVYLMPLPKVVQKSKIERIRALIPKFAQYEVYIYHKLNDLMDEIIRWSPVHENKTDDLIDALAWQVYFWDRKPGKIEARAEERQFTLNWWMRMAQRRPEQHILQEWMDEQRPKTDIF